MDAGDLEPMPSVDVLLVQVGVVDDDHSRYKKGDFLVVQ